MNDTSRIEQVRSGWAGLISTFVRHPNAANLLMVLMIIFDN